MYELFHAAENTYCINSPAKVGLWVRDGGEAVLIDSGSDKDAGRRVRKLLDENGLKLAAIVNTHSNADHIGGNRYLQQQTGCRIYAKGIEAAFTRDPILEPSFLYGGYPCRDLRHKFLLAEKSDVLPIEAEGFPGELEVIELPGHFFHMIGMRTPDDVVFLADCVSSRATLDKYKVPFIHDVGAYLGTLDMVEKLEAKLFVPAHDEASEDIRALVQYNRACVTGIADRLLEICAEPLNAEEIIKRIFDGFALVMNFEQYVLVGSTVRSYLSWLRDGGRMDANFEDNHLLWRAV